MLRCLDVKTHRGKVYYDKSSLRANAKQSSENCHSELGATHVVHWNNSRKIAFTLAEVLITLGIIGVVAALTMPSLIANYRNQAYVTQLKKTVSTLEQGFQLMKADDGVDSLQDTGLFSQYSGINSSNHMSYLFISAPNQEPDVTKLFGKYFKFVGDSGVVMENYFSHRSFVTLSKQKTTHSPIGGLIPMISLNDGSLVAFYISPSGASGTSCEYVDISVDKCDPLIGHIGIDVNGLKGPNQYGRDMFWFMLSRKGKLIPWGSEYISKFNIGNNWKSDKTMCGEKGKPIGIGVSGEGCAARIIENGWKMDY